MKRLILYGLLPLAFLFEVTTSSAQTDFNYFPIKVSANHRYLVDQKNNPFLYIADTPWDIFYIWTNEEVEEYLEKRKQQGFNVIQVQLLVDDYTLKNTEGQHPLNGTLDLSNRNEAFFKHVDWVIHEAGKKGIAVMIAPAWLSCCVPGWHNGLKINGVAKAKEFGEFLGKRYNYKDFPNIIGWIYGGDSDPGSELDEVKAIAEGIQEEEGRYPRLQTAHWSSPNSTRDITNGVSWLNLNATYTYSSDKTNAGKPQYQVYATSIKAFLRKPAQPFFLIESQYETNKSSSQSEVIRRQSYWSLLSGSTGFAYGSADCCGYRKDWKKVMEMPVANQIKYLKNLFTSIAWQKLIPDGLPDPAIQANHKWIVKGYGTYYDKAGPAENEGTDYITAAGTKDGKLMVAYIPSTGTGKRTFTVQMESFSGKVTARWMNPVNGKYMPASKNDLPNKGNHVFTTPGDNGTGQNDWVLIMEVK